MSVTLLKVPPLLEALKLVPDFRSRHGRRYSLEAVFALGVTAMLCGYNTYGIMAQWGKNYPAKLAGALDFKNGRTPSVGTLFAVFWQVDKDALLRPLFAWNEQVLATLPGDSQTWQTTSVEDKALRGSAKQ